MVHTHKRNGFTLVELLVVVAIIMLLLGIVMVSISQARQSARDKSRLSDLANIEFALTLYNERERTYPSYPSGIEIGVGGALDASIAALNGNTYRDPSSDGESGDTYAYWYDSDFTCTQSNQKVIFARSMEQEKNGNFDDVCTDPGADTAIAGESTYIIVLKQ